MGNKLDFFVNGEKRVTGHRVQGQTTTLILSLKLQQLCPFVMLLFITIFLPVAFRVLY